MILRMFAYASVLLSMLCWTAPSWAFSFVAASTINASSDVASGTSVTCSKPTGTADNDLMLAIVKNGAMETFTPPSGWASFGSPLTGDTASSRHMLYWRVASSEGTSYSWTWATSARGGCSIFTFRSDFNTSDPVDVSSNTPYTTSNTTARAASMTTTATNEAIILVRVGHTSTSQTCDTWPSSPTTFTEHADSHDGNSRFARCVGSAVWSSSGATGDMDITISATTTDKHVFGIALKPAAAGGVSIRGPLLGVFP